MATDEFNEQEIIEYIENHSKNFIEKPHDYFGGMPICPFARRARTKKLIKYIVKPFDRDDQLTEDSFLMAETRQWLTEDGWEMLWFLSPQADLLYEDYMELYKRFEEKLVPLDLVIFPGHRDHDFVLGGMYVQAELFPNIQVVRVSKVQETRNKLFRTPYFDKMTDKELIDLGVPLDFPRNRCPEQQSEQQ